MIRELLKKVLGSEFTTSEDKYQKINVCLIVLSIILFGILYFFLPESIPALNRGSEMIYIPKLFGVLLVPVVLAIIDFTLVIQKRTNIISTASMGILTCVLLVHYINMI